MALTIKYLAKITIDNPAKGNAREAWTEQVYIETNQYDRDKIILGPINHLYPGEKIVISKADLIAFLKMEEENNG